jgi:hypothetical protein
MKIPILFITSAVLTMFMGCSGVTAVHIPTDEADLLVTGFRYYESSPYILVYSDGKVLKSDLIYLPDRTRKMSVELFDFISSNTAKLTFLNGVLTSAETEGDSTAVPKAVIESAKQVAIAAAKGAAALSMVKEEEKAFAAPAPRLFKLVIDGQGARLIGSSPTIEIKVNVPEGG